MFAHLAQTAPEFAFYPRAACPLPFPRDVESQETLESVVQRGPAIFVTAHLGNWEVFGVTGGGCSLPLNTVVRPLDNARLNRWITARRAAGPQKTHPTEGAPGVLAKALDRGEP